jgi:hypothetical protein
MGSLWLGGAGFPAWEARANGGEIWGISFVTILHDFDNRSLMLLFWDYITFCMYNAFNQRQYARTFPAVGWPVSISYNSSTDFNARFIFSALSLAVVLWRVPHSSLGPP